MYLLNSDFPAKDNGIDQTYIKWGQFYKITCKQRVNNFFIFNHLWNKVLNELTNFHIVYTQYIHSIQRFQSRS